MTDDRMQFTTDDLLLHAEFISVVADDETNTMIVFNLKFVAALEDRYRFALWWMHGGEPPSVCGGHKISTSSPILAPDERWIAIAEREDETTEPRLPLLSGGTQSPAVVATPIFNEVPERYQHVSPVACVDVHAATISTHL